MRSLFETGTPDEAVGALCEIPGERSNGETFTMELSLAEYGNGGNHFVVGVARDISQHKRAEGALMEANRKLQELDALKSEFLSTASHELRTPLTIIGQFAGILRDGIAGQLTGDQLECVNTILGNTDRLGALINDVLDLQKIRSGRIRVFRNRCDIGELLHNCARDFQPAIALKSQSLEVDLSPELSPVLCDRNKITQVLVNLIGNATKYTPLGGRITLRAHSEDGSVKISVSDDGPGIPEEHRDRIFDQFIQIEERNGPGCGGSGLGLTIAKSIVELHDGSIAVEGEPGSGTTFWFTIPIFDEREAVKALIADRLRGCRASNHALSMAVVKLRSEHSSIQSVSTQRFVESELLLAANIARSSMRRENDAICTVSSDGLLAILCETERGRGQALIVRVLMSILNSLETGISVSLTSLKIEPDVEDIAWLETAISNLRPINRKTFGKSVLIVDDDLEVVQTVTDAMTRCGMTLIVELTQDKLGACAKLCKLEPNLVILDIDQSDNNRGEVINLLRNDHPAKSARVLIVADDESHLTEMLELGADDGLRKPFTANQLIEKTESLLLRPIQIGVSTREMTGECIT
ncbi:MAG: response regulator [candidate division Zixibacteria bacterium]|nr:response regulator [candidate division Zixibacteria bacterium]MBU1471404.1 response regulator [candidate division Zixibacteria bacterium]MBU2626801.1 response regulator [candidate division Zixibacteria bacterium]